MVLLSVRQDIITIIYYLQLAYLDSGDHQVLALHAVHGGHDHAGAGEEEQETQEHPCWDHGGVFTDLMLSHSVFAEKI